MRPFSLVRTLKSAHVFRQGKRFGNNTGVQARSSSSGKAGSAQSATKGAGQDHMRGIIDAALTSGAFAGAGDCLAQTLPSVFAKGIEPVPQRIDGNILHISIPAMSCFVQGDGKSDLQFDVERAARMVGFGFCLYGPFQYWWYRALSQRFPLKTTPHFLAKVALNQVVLGPLVLSAVFSWNLTLQHKAGEIQDKIKRDLVSLAINAMVGQAVSGWKFWVPAASINFYWIPLRWQVLYMSACSVVWTAYLSYSSYNRVKRAEI